MSPWRCPTCTWEGERDPSLGVVCPRCGHSETAPAQRMAFCSRCGIPFELGRGIQVHTNSQHEAFVRRWWACPGCAPGVLAAWSVAHFVYVLGGSGPATFSASPWPTPSVPPVPPEELN